jgi:hypothetical protein
VPDGRSWRDAVVGMSSIRRDRRRGIQGLPPTGHLNMIEWPKLTTCVDPSKVDGSTGPFTSSGDDHA